MYDLGCGPGHTTALLHSCGVAVRGLDLSPRLLEHARSLPFDEGDMLSLPYADGAAAGVVSFYSIVHFDPSALRTALGEIHRVLEEDGCLLLGFHVGEDRVQVEEFLGRPVSLEFAFFTPELIRSELSGAGFVEVAALTREPYPEVEYPSRRAYLLARRAPTA